MSSAEPQYVLGETAAKQLCDKLYEKRRVGAVEIEGRVQRALQSQPTGENEEVRRLIQCLEVSYINNREEPAHRKGGLIGLAAVAVGLGQRRIGEYLPSLLPLVVGLFKDTDSRVRYYACEALFNIMKVAQFTVVAHFNAVFDGLCDLFADTDPDVNKGLKAVDELIRELVLQCPEHFDMAGFVPLLEKKVHHKNHSIRLYVLQVLQWLLKLETLRPQLVQCLPSYLEGILAMLEEKLPQNVRISADNCLQALLKAVKAAPDDAMLEILAKTVGVIAPKDAWSAVRRLTAADLLYQYVELKRTRTGDAEDNRKWLAMLPQLLAGCLNLLNSQEKEIVTLAVKLSNGLLALVLDLPGDVPVGELLEGLLKAMELANQHESRAHAQELQTVHTVCLQWLCMLLERSRSEVLLSELLDRLLEHVFDALLSERDHVVANALAVLGRIMDGARDEAEFARVTRELLQLFRKQPSMLDAKGGTMIRHLCGNLDGRHLYVTVARLIQQSGEDLDFAQRLVQTFNWVLLTSAETKALRDELFKTKPLQDLAPAQGRPLFVELLEPWFFNPISALALCLWAQQYEFAVEMINRLAVFDTSVDMLRQLDQLVHLLETPVFSGLRLRLLEPRRHPALFKCLLGLAMLLPQAGAFKALSERIRVVQSGLLLEFQQLEQQLLDQSQGAGGRLPLPPAAASAGAGAPGAPGEDAFEGLLCRFDSIAAASKALA